MNVPGIRAALMRMQAIPDAGIPQDPLYAAVVTVGLRACDKWEKWSLDADSPVKRFRLMRKEREFEVIADILREAGVEVEQ